MEKNQYFFDTKNLLALWRGGGKIKSIVNEKNLLSQEMTEKEKLTLSIGEKGLHQWFEIVKNQGVISLKRIPFDYWPK